MEFTTRFGLHSQATRLREAPGPARRGAATGLTPSAGCGLDHKDLGPPRAPPGRGASAYGGLSRGATPARRVSTRRPGGEAPPRPPPARLPAAHTRPGQGDGDATGGARAGTAAGDGGRLPADRPRRGDTRRAATPPLGTGSPALAGLRRRRARRALAPRAGGRSGEGAAGGPARRRGARSRSEAVEGRGTAAPRRGAAPAGDRGGRRPEERGAAGAGGRRRLAAEEGQRARALCPRRPLRRGERAGPAAGRAPRPLRRGRAAERGGQGAPPRRGALGDGRSGPPEQAVRERAIKKVPPGRGHGPPASARLAAVGFPTPPARGEKKKKKKAGAGTSKRHMAARSATT
ncbi:unnamed protein product, partial [Coccothraustes coccothraustes]